MVMHHMNRIDSILSNDNTMLIGRKTYVHAIRAKKLMRSNSQCAVCAA